MQIYIKTLKCYTVSQKQKSCRWLSRKNHGLVKIPYRLQTNRATFQFYVFLLWLNSIKVNMNRRRVRVVNKIKQDKLLKTFSKEIYHEGKVYEIRIKFLSLMKYLEF